MPLILGVSASVLIVVVVLPVFLCALGLLCVCHMAALLFQDEWLN